MINSIFSTQKLGTLCSKIGSGATPRGGSQVYLDSGKIALIRSQNVRNEYFSKNGLVYIEKVHADKLSNVTIEPDDVLLNITGDSVARCCQVSDEVIPARVNQHVAIIRPISEKLYPLFLRYFFISPEMQNYMLSLAGAGATRNALTKIMIETFDIPVPDLPEQKAIAHILGSLDDKIELNRKMNETLEAMAQALFKSWFIDFDPVLDNAILAGNPIPEEFAERAEIRRALGDKRKQLPPEIQKLFPSEFIFTDELVWIPKGWEVEAVSEFGQIVCGKTPPKKNPDFYGDEIPFIKIPDMHNQVFAIKTTEYLSSDGAKYQIKKQIPKGSICVSCIATVGKVVIASQDSHTNQQINSIVPLRQEFSSYLYFYMLELCSHLHILASGGSATLNLNTGNFSKIQILKPDNNILELFDSKVKINFEKILNLSHENETLSKLRDTLLPKLLSGELRIKDAEKLVEGVL